MPVPIGNQQTISAPHMHATALELLAENLQPGCKVLDVGSGAGPQRMCFSFLFNPQKMDFSAVLLPYQGFRCELHNA